MKLKMVHCRHLRLAIIFLYAEDRTLENHNRVGRLHMYALLVKAEGSH